MKRSIWAVFVLVLITFTACGGDSGTGPDNSGNILGTYTLQTLNGKALPTVDFEYPGYRSEILSSKLILENTGYRTEDTYRVTENGTVTTNSYSHTGTWERVLDKITLNNIIGEPAGEGTIGNNSITVRNAGYIYIYHK